MVVVKEKVIEVYLQNKSNSMTARIFGVSRQRIHQIVKNYHNSGKHGRLKKYERKLFGKKCYICGKLPAELLHHKDFDNKNDVVSNLIPCCVDCHGFLHRQKNESWLGKHKKCLGCHSTKRKHFRQGYCKECFLAKERMIRPEWSRYYENCIECHLTKYTHRAKGLCEKCYERKRYFKKRKFEWSLYHENCIKCHSTATRHTGYGLCSRCYQKKKYWENRNKTTY